MRELPKLCQPYDVKDGEIKRTRVVWLSVSLSTGRPISHTQLPKLHLIADI